MVVICPSQCHRGQKVKADLAIRFRIVSWIAVFLWHEGGVVFSMVLESPWLLPPKEPGEECSVGHPSPVAQPSVEGRANIPHHHQLLPHPATLHPILIALQVEACGQESITEDLSGRASMKYIDKTHVELSQLARILINLSYLRGSLSGLILAHSCHNNITFSF